MESTRQEICRYLGIKGPKQGFFSIDERVLEALDVGLRWVGGMPMPKTGHCRTENGVTYNFFGIGCREINGHSEICVNPLRDADIDTVMKYEFPDPENIDRNQLKIWAEQAKWLHENTDYAKGILSEIRNKKAQLYDSTAVLFR